MKNLIKFVKNAKKMLFEINEFLFEIKKLLFEIEKMLFKTKKIEMLRNIVVCFNKCEHNNVLKIVIHIKNNYYKITRCLKRVFVILISR